MKTGIWLIENREIPSVGMARKGECVTLPDAMFAEFLERKYIKKLKKEKKDGVRN